MHRIDTPTAKNGKFVDGNPHKPKEEHSTQLNADWFNGVQENICNVITMQGMPLLKGEHYQLHKAIVASSYRLQILSHLKAMVDFLRPISDEITLPSEVTYSSNFLDVLNQVIDALDHISDEAKVPERPTDQDDLSGILKAINALIPGVKDQSERPLNLKPIIEMGD